MPTFLALQCYNCNMMQVKHEKKSSNKWTCSLCNEKQSVRKVFATSMAAKDIRSFVQDYNFSRNSAQDRALAELVLDVDEDGNAGFAHDDVFCGENSQACRDILSGHQEVIVGSKWNEYLPQDDRKYAEVSQETIDDAKFVTVIPDRRAKGRIRAAPNNYSEQHRVQEKQRKTDKPSSRPSESIRECLHATQKENGLPYASSQKVSLNSSPQLPNPPSIQYGQRLTSYKVPQRIVANAPMQAIAAGVQLGKRKLMPSSLTKSKALTEMKPPVSRYTTCSGEENSQEVVKQEKHVSKWAKYMDSDCWPSAKDACESSIWSLRAANNMHYMDGLLKTELDDDNVSGGQDTDDETH